MLGEAFLYVLNHTGDVTNHPDFSAPPHAAMMRPDPAMMSGTARPPLTPRALRAGRPGALEKPGLCQSTTQSSAVPIVGCCGEDHMGMTLFCSWCCPSFYKDYPDLLLAGDRLERWSSHNPELDSRPVLHSLDLSSMKASPEEGQATRAGTQRDEGYLIMRSSVQDLGCDRRPTNSMLNGFLEVQMLEVLCQHMQNMACCGSSLLGADVMPTLAPKELGGEDGMGCSSNSVVRYLSTCSVPATSHFSSPVLRISEDE